MAQGCHFKRVNDRPNNRHQPANTNKELMSMSITNRLREAKLLYDTGHCEGALLSVLIAVAGSSRKRFPPKTISRRDPSRQMGDAEAFETFMGEEMQRI